MQVPGYSHFGGRHGESAARVEQVEQVFQRAMTLSPPEGLQLIRETVQSGREAEAMGVKKVSSVSNEGGEVQPLGPDSAGYRSIEI